MLKTGRAEKVDIKWDHLSSFHASFLICGPEIVQKSAFSAIFCWRQPES